MMLVHSGMPQVSGVTQTVEWLQELEALMRLKLKFWGWFLEVQVKKERVFRLQICLRNVGRPYFEIECYCQCQKHNHRVRLQSNGSMNNEVFHTIRVTAYDIPPFVLDCSVDIEFDCENRTTLQNISILGDVFEMYSRCISMEVPRARIL